MCTWCVEVGSGLSKLKLCHLRFASVETMPDLACRLLTAEFLVKSLAAVCGFARLGRAHGVLVSQPKKAAKGAPTEDEQMAALLQS